MRVSIIVPVLNEAEGLSSFLESILSLPSHEVILADGGSTDSTREIAQRYPVLWVESPAGRGPQMNSGARQASGDILLFVHADVRFSPNAMDAIRQALENPRILGGVFDVHFDGNDWVARTFYLIYHWRRYLGIFYGDAGIFVRRDVFQSMGGFRNFPIMEDYEFGRRLFGWGGRMAMLSEPIHVSDRRWRKDGLIKTVFVWIVIQTAFSLGYPAERLGRLYRQIR